MDPAGVDKVCERCGTYEGALLSTHHAGWLCADVEACERRAAERVMQGQWTVVERSSGTLESALPGWAAGADIPEENQIFIVTPHHREEITDPETKAYFAKLLESTRPVAWADPLHPTGRCTCGGEGRCAWCDEICQTCMGDGVGEEPWLVCEGCCGTGYADGLEMTAEERAAKIAAIRADEADYEAMGYPETGVWWGSLEIESPEGPFFFASMIGHYSGQWAGELAQRLMMSLDAIQKDIRSDTDSD